MLQNIGKLSDTQKDKFKQFLEKADDRGRHYYSRWLITEDLVQIFSYSRAADIIILVGVVLTPKVGGDLQDIGYIEFL